MGCKVPGTVQAVYTSSPCAKYPAGWGFFAGRLVRFYYIVCEIMKPSGVIPRRLQRDPPQAPPRRTPVSVCVFCSPPDGPTSTSTTAALVAV